MPHDLPGASPLLCELADRGMQQAYRKGRRLIEEGQEGQTLYIVLSGRLRVFSEDAERGRELLIGHYGPGEYVGEMSLDGGKRSASVAAAEKSVCVMVTRTTLDGFLRERPAFAYELLEKVIRRARAATLSARTMAVNDVYGRLRLYLEREARTQPDGTRSIVPRPSHREIASAIGASHGMVTRLMGDLCRAGVLVCDRSSIRFAGRLPVRW